MKRLTRLAFASTLVAGLLQLGTGCGDDGGGSGGSEPGAGGGAEGVCGDNLLDDDLGEECDDGDPDDTDDCKTDCTLNVCGDGAVHVGEEECDDGNDDDDDKCKNDCTLGVTGCGNGELDDGEDCDDGNLVDDDGCSRTCEEARCGDGVVQPGEDCDDGNTEDGDACSNDCGSGEGCGNGTVDGGEECDDGNRSSGDDCLNDCTEASCGDGYAQAGVEACDDGNDDDGDFCRNDCTLNEEIDGACPGAPISLPIGSHGYEWTTDGAENTDHGSCEGNDSPEVAFEVVPEEDGTLTIRLASDGSWDAVLYARDGSCEEGDEIDCSDFAAENGVEEISMQAFADEPIWVFADGYAATSGAFTIEFDLEGDEPPPADGDTCATAVDLFVDSSELGEASGNTSQMFDDYIGEGLCAAGDGPDIVYAITPLEDGTMTVVVEAPFDVVLYALIDCGVTSSQLECADAAVEGGGEVLEDLPAYAGETLYVVVDGYDGASGSFDVLVELTPD